MSKSKDTKPELRLQEGLIARGLSFEKHMRQLPGTPDIVFAPQRLIIFVHGCYWHRHAQCNGDFRATASSVEATKRMNDNVRRDFEIKQSLEELGWVVYIAWECDINMSLASVLSDVETLLQRV